MKIHSTKTLVAASVASLAIFAALLGAQPAAAQSASKPKPAASRSSSPAEIDKKVDAAANAYRAGRYAEAANLFREVVKLDPRHVQAWHFLGQSLVKTGQTMEARMAFQRALEIEPSGKVAERTREALAKLPPPDLTQISLPSGLTLKDWLDLAGERIAAGEGRTVLTECAGYIKAYGPLPPLVELRDRMLTRVLARIETDFPESARASLAVLKALRDLVGEVEPLVLKEALANHMAGDYAAAQQAYSRWLKLASANDSRRSLMVKNLLRSRKREAIKMSDGKEYRVSHIMVKTEDEAKKIIEQLKVNKFEDIAIAKSLDTGSGARGGALGWTVPSNFTRPFADVMVALSIGSISTPVQTQYGWHIIRLEDVRE